MTANLRRIEALEGVSSAWRPHCWLTARDDDSVEQAVARHRAEEGCIENSGGHVVWCVVGSGAQQEPVS